MQSQLIFQEQKEMERLRVQNELLSGCEAPLFAQLFSGRSGLRVLDVGSNDGTKTVDRFSNGAVGRVIGLEYNGELAARAQERYGDERFAFYACDVEAPAFARRLRNIMERESIDGFDVICLSFVLVNLRDAADVLRALRAFLRPGGRLVIIEPNDSACTLSNDADALLGDFLEILRRDPYAGDRSVGENLLTTLGACGYGDVRVWCEGVSAHEGEMERKWAIFETFFSYLPADVALLRAAEPENETYRAWEDWLGRNYDSLRRLTLREDSRITMGLRILTCGRVRETRHFTLGDGRAFALVPLTREELETAHRLCDECVGVNLYSAEEIAAAIDAPDKGFYLLKNEAGEAVGYVYYRLSGIDQLAVYSKLGEEPFRAVCPEEYGRAGQLQSIGLRADHRGFGLAARMVAFVRDELEALGAGAIFVACWNHSGGIVPLRGAVRQSGLRFLAQAHGMWYDDETLVCPYCKGRCVCGAEFQYKLLGGEGEE